MLYRLICIVSLILSGTCAGEVTSQPAGPTVLDIEKQRAPMIVDMLKKCAVVLSKEDLSAENRASMSSIYRAAWDIALQFACTTSDQGDIKLILQEWEIAWKDKSTASILTGSLADVGDVARDFVVKDVLKQWQSADDDATLNSMAYWIAKYGNSDDAKFLEDKMHRLADPEKQQILQNALNWMKYWRNGNSPAPGPAAAPPHPG